MAYDKTKVSLLAVFLTFYSCYGSAVEEKMNRTSTSTLGPLIMCECQPPGVCQGLDYCHTHQGCWTAMVMVNGAERLKMGCSSSEPNNKMTCNTKSNRDVAVLCCNNGTRCNRYLMPERVALPEIGQGMSGPNIDGNTILMIMLPFVALVFVLVLLVFLCHLRHRRRMNSLNHQEKHLLDGELQAHEVGDTTLRELLEESCTSGSGSGLPFLVQQTVARQVQLMDCIGKGRYGEVWRGKYHGESVAVKIFLSRDESSWRRETDIYNTVLLRHDNILGYYASDMTSQNSCTQLWLIMQYHPNGSLYDYLQYHTLNHVSMLKLMYSSCAGIVHLHTEILGNRGKPAIAHRDVKSKNILVKKDGTACIADLGLAVLHTCEGNKLDLGTNNKVGTKRYMAPELLDETLNPELFESFKCVDIYAFSLVLWEIARRCYTQGMVEDYKPPFYDVVPGDPSFEDMRKVVVVDQYRPTIPNRWSSDMILCQLSRVMKECWNQNAKARLPSLRLKKTLKKLLEEAKDDELDKSMKNMLIEKSANI